jgi:hypothetical protein
MKAYVATSGTIFGLLVIAHLLRVFAEGTRVASDAFFVVSTLIAAGLSLWAVRLLRQSPQR